MRAGSLPGRCVITRQVCDDGQRDRKALSYPINNPVTMEPRINVITLGVSDFDRSLAFYRDGIGWEAHVQGDLALFSLNGMIFALYPRESLADDANVPARETGFPGFTLAYLTRNEAEVDITLKKAGSAGARIAKPGQKTFWGGYSGYFADPDEYLWEVAFNPFWKLDPEGRVRL